MAPGQSRPKGPGALTTERLARACAGALAVACDAKWMLVDEAVCAGRLHPLEASGAKFLIARRAARSAGTYEDFYAKFPTSGGRGLTFIDPGFYAFAPLSTELIHTLMQFVDGAFLARFSMCSPQLRVRADKIASEGLARITTLRLGQRAVARWRTELRLFAVLTNPPNLRSLLSPSTAWAPIRDHVDECYTSCDNFLVYLDERTNYNLEDHRAYMAKYALRLGDAAVIEGVMRTTEPNERHEHRRDFYKYLYTRKRYLKNYLSDHHHPAWCATMSPGTEISNHFLRVERVQAAAAARKSISEYSPLLQSAAKHDRYFPDLEVVDDADDWGYVDAMIAMGY